MNRTEFSVSPDLKTFLTYLRPERLEALARAYWQRVLEHDLPMLRLLAKMPEEQIEAGNVASLDAFIGTLLDGTALEVAAEGLRRWENDEIPGFSKYDFQPRDLILVGDAHSGAMIGFLDDYTDDRALALRIVRELRAFYLRSELIAYETYSRIRDEAVSHATKAEAEAEAAHRSLEETQTLNEELLAQQEELNDLYKQLQAHSQHVEREVARRTEELQTANEELEAHHEELVTVNEQLHQQTVALAEQHAFIENMVRNLPIGVAFMDRDLVFRWVNPEFASFADLPVDAFTARQYYEVFPTMENPNSRLLTVLESGQSTRVTALPIHTQDGERTYWDIVYVPVFDVTGQVDGLMLMSQDATTRVQHERLQQTQIEQLHEVDRLKNEFLSILSHELRTPINAIMGFASILDDEVTGPLNPEQHSFTQRILTGSDVLLGLIEDLLDMSRIQAGKFSLSPAPIAPAPIIEEAVAGLSHLAERKGQAIAVTVEDALPVLEADAQRLRQILTNLVGNAIKFGPDGDTIEVRARMVGDVFRCEIEDHGEGIAEEDIPKLFQRFTQLDSGNTRKAGGAGLGLSIVKALVEAHGGEIGLSSDPGARTLFWFTLPTKPPLSDD